MNMRRIAVMCAALLACGAILAPLAAQGPAMEITYSPAPDWTLDRQLQLTIPDVALNDMPTGLFGSGTTTLRWTVVPAAEGEALDETALQGEVLSLTTVLAGQPMPASLLPVARIRISPQAIPVDLPTFKSDPLAPDRQLPQIGLAALGAALLCALPPLPDHAVAVGDSWERGGTFEIKEAVVGQVEVTQKIALTSLADGVATFTSTVHALLPDFQAPNPLLPGQTLTCQAMTVDVPELVQTYDVARSQVTEARAKLNLKANLVAPEMTAAVAVTGADLLYLELPPAAPQN